MPQMNTDGLKAGDRLPAFTHHRSKCAECPRSGQSARSVLSAFLSAYSASQW